MSSVSQLKVGQLGMTLPNCGWLSSKLLLSEGLTHALFVGWDRECKAGRGGYCLFL